jgi:hypothetical protein
MEEQRAHHDATNAAPEVQRGHDAGNDCCRAALGLVELVDTSRTSKAAKASIATATAVDFAAPGCPRRTSANR